MSFTPLFTEPITIEQIVAVLNAVSGPHEQSLLRIVSEGGTFQLNIPGCQFAFEAMKDQLGGSIIRISMVHQQFPGRQYHFLMPVKIGICPDATGLFALEASP